MWYYCSSQCYLTVLVSVETALFDSEVQAFAVGAIRKDDILKYVFIKTCSQCVAEHISSATLSTPTLLSNVSFGGFGEKASTLAWVENTLQVPYSFQVLEPQKYVVPAPLDLPPSVPARWLSDVAIMNPSCTWANPQTPIRYTDFTTLNYTKIALDGVGVTITLQSYSFLCMSAYLVRTSKSD